MLAISVEFLHGTFRGDPDGTAVTGRATQGEWPPSPARLLAALVAGDGTRRTSRVTDGHELLWLEGLPAPTIYAHADAWHQPLHPRFVVTQSGGPEHATHQEYPARRGTAHRPGVRVAPRTPLVVYRWDVEAPNAATLEALELRAARVGYLGASDSPVRLRVATQLPCGTMSKAFVPDGEGDTHIRIPASGDVDMLDRMYDAWCKRGASVTRAQFPALTHWATYRAPSARERVDRGAVVAWLRLDHGVSGRRVSEVTALFKAAVLDRHQRMHGAPAAILHGHGFAGPGYDLARYLALPDVGYRHSRGRIHGLALWLPAESKQDERHKAREAALAIDELVGARIKVRVEPHAGEGRPFAAHPRRWRGPSRAWVTALPAIHERRGVPDLGEGARWCRHAGLPEPVAFQSSRTPVIHGAVDLAPREVNRPGRPALPYSHVAFLFAEPIAGPVVVGAGRQRGFGLCVPADD